MIEFFFITYLLSGFTKCIFLSLGIPMYIDFTSLSILLLFTNIIINRKNLCLNTSLFKNKGFKNILILLSFYIWMAITLFYTTSEHYSFLKTMLFSTNILAFCIPIFIPNFSLQKGIKIYTIYTICYSFIFLISNPETPEYNFLPNIINITPLSGFYLEFGELIGLNVLLLLYSKNIIYKVTTISFLLYVLILTAARGPMIFTFFTLFIYCLITIKKLIHKKELNLRAINQLKLVNQKTIFIPIVSILIMAGSFAIPSIKAQASRTLYRYEVAIKNDAVENKSVTLRKEFISSSIGMIFQNPERCIFGYGIGSYKFQTTGVDGRGYPHNILLEIWFELGVIGLLIFLFFIGHFISIVYKEPFIILIFIYIALNLLKSSSLTDLRLYMGIISILLFGLLYKKENSHG